MVDFNRLLFAPVFGILGADAVLDLGTIEGPKTVRAIDRTKGVATQSQSFDSGARGANLGMDTHTIRPVISVRMPDFLAAGFTLDELAVVEGKGTIHMNNKTWGIKTHELFPGAEGEESGEVLLILEEEPE